MLTTASPGNVKTLVNEKERFSARVERDVMKLLWKMPFMILTNALLELSLIQGGGGIEK